MSITLAYDAITIDLPDDLVWRDEFAWKKVAQQKTHALFGALIIESGSRLAGQPMTLEADEMSAWCSRETLRDLRAAADIAGQQFTLTRLAVPHTVMFDHESGAIDARPIADYSDPADADWYVVTLRFLKV